MIELIGYVLLIILYFTTIVSIINLNKRFKNVKNNNLNCLNLNDNSVIENDTCENNNDLLVWGWAINPDRKKMEEGSKRFLDTSNKYKFNSELIGIGYTIERPQGQDRFYVLRDRLNNVKDDQIVLVMDTFDTLMCGTPNEVLKRFKKENTQILFSAEKAYTFQYMENKHYFENENSDYKYLAAGTYIGYAGAIRKMNDECIYMLENQNNLKKAAEMGIMGLWLGEKIKNTQLCKLDTKCNIFWVTSDDKDHFHSNIDSNEKINNKVTKTEPIVLHVVGATAIDDRSNYYQKAYEKIMKF